jgi:hypothetical protein
MFDGDHLYWHGIIQLLIDYNWKKLTGDQKKILAARYEEFTSPSNFIKPAVTFGTKSFAVGWTMTQWKHVALVCFKVFEGLLNNASYTLLVETYLFIVKLFSGQFSVDDIPSLQKKNDGLISKLEKAMHETTSHLDRPNGHAMVCMLQHTLPAIVSIRLANCSPFEAHHKFSKQLQRGVSSTHAGDVALNQYNAKETFQVIHTAFFFPIVCAHARGSHMHGYVIHIPHAYTIYTHRW